MLTRAFIGQWTVETRAGLMPVDIAAQRGHQDVAEVLLDAMIASQRARAQDSHHMYTMLERKNAYMARIAQENNERRAADPSLPPCSCMDFDAGPGADAGAGPGAGPCKGMCAFKDLP